MASDATLADGEIRERVRSLVAEHMRRKPPRCAQLVRDQVLKGDTESNPICARRSKYTYDRAAEEFGSYVILCNDL